MKAYKTFCKYALNRGVGVDGWGRLGYPKSDIERVMTHYNISQEKAIDLLRKGKVKLPRRGTGLFTNQNK